MLIKHLSSKQIMLQVVYALFPAIIAYYVLFGTAVITHLFTAVITALVTEFIALYIKGEKIASIVNSLNDKSAVITALLLALSIPLNLSWYLVVAGVFFALIFGKHVFGGLGHNVFNAAMLGFVFLIISFPAQMTDYSYFSNSNIENIDVITGATVLDGNKHNLNLYANAKLIMIVNLSFALGGLYLLWRKIIFWHTPVAILLTILIMGFLFDDVTNHLLFGGTFIGAFFIATDGVTSPVSNSGKFIYGLLIGVLTVIIREFSMYPDGIAFAILIGNMFTPLIDYYVKN